MFRIIKIDILLRLVVLATVILSVLIFALLQKFLLPDITLFRLVTIASIVSSALIISLLSASPSRKLWGILARFNQSVYPDLNGSWEGSITLDNGTELQTRAVIRQNLQGIYIDMHGETVKSITVETTPAVEQGQKKLYYIYRATPKDPSWESYIGTTLFDLRVVGTGKGKTQMLSGSYYTNRKTWGRVELTQTSRDPNIDVSFY